MLERLARWSFRRRKLMVLVWIVALVAAGTLASRVGGEYSQDFSLPGSDSQAAYDLLKERFPQFAGDTADIVFKADEGVADPRIRSAMEGLFSELEKVDHVVA